MVQALLFTEPREAYTSALHEAGVEAHFVRIFESISCNEEVLLNELENNVPDAIVVTSKNALRLPFTQKARGIPLYVPGPATQSYAQSLGFTKIRGQNTGSAFFLSQLIKKEMHNKKILYLKGTNSLNVIENELQGANLSQICVYSTKERTTLAQDLIEILNKVKKQLQVLNLNQVEKLWLMFFSPSGFYVIKRFLVQRNSKVFLEISGNSISVMLGSVGKTTSAPIKEVMPLSLEVKPPISPISLAEAFSVIS